MLRPLPRSILFPYTTLFRSVGDDFVRQTDIAGRNVTVCVEEGRCVDPCVAVAAVALFVLEVDGFGELGGYIIEGCPRVGNRPRECRSEERRVGEECRVRMVSLF